MTSPLPRFRAGRTLGLALALGAGLLLPGCMGYRVGSMLPPDLKTVYVPTFINLTGEPQIETEVTRATVEAIQVDHSLEVAAEAGADAILYVTLLKYDLAPLVYQKERKTAATEYRLVLTASVILKRRSDGKVLVDACPVSGDWTFPVVGDFTSSKVEGLPNVARELAKYIVERITDSW